MDGEAALGYSGRDEAALAELQLPDDDMGPPLHMFLLPVPPPREGGCCCNVVPEEVLPL